MQGPWGGQASPWAVGGPRGPAGVWGAWVAPLGLPRGAPVFLLGGLLLGDPARKDESIGKLFLRLALVAAIGYVLVGFWGHP